MWAARRSGLYITTVNSYLSAEEVAYILDDSGSRSLVTTTAKADVAAEALRDAPRVTLPLLIGDADARFEPYVDAISAMPTRSEEHTSELQSLMRNSYDVFCLKKNTT